MVLIEFIKQFVDKPKLHGDIWFYILCRTNRKIYVNEIMYKYKISKSSLYRIFSLYKIDITDNEEKIIFNLKNSYIYSLTESNKNRTKKRTPKKVKNIIVEAEEINIKSDDIYKDIITYLNEKSGKRYSYKNAQTKKYINARIKDGYNISDFKKVIDIKCIKWINSSMEDYLRPQTLFSNKFEGYINETLNNNKKDTVDKANETISKAKQFNWEFDS